MGALSDHVGRKPTIALANVMFIIGGCLMATATDFYSMALGRVSAGSGVGIGITAVTAYMAEVAPAAERGLYGSLEELFVNVGNIVGYLMNVALVGMKHDWRIMLGAAVPPAFCVVITMLLPFNITGIPESPRYLEKVGRHEEAREALLELLDGDLEEVDVAVGAWKRHDGDDGDGMASWGETLTAFSGEHKPAATAGIGVGVLNMFTGVMLMMVASSLVLVSAGMDKKAAMKVTVGLGFAKATTMLFVALFLLDRWGRIPLLKTSCTISASGAAVGALGSFLGLGNAWKIAGLCLFVTGYSVGVGPVPWVYMPETLPSRYRSKGVSLGLSGARLCAVTQLFFFPLLLPKVGMLGLFAFLLVVNVVGLGFVSKFCPETMGHTLEEVSAVFRLEKEKKLAED